MGLKMESAEDQENEKNSKPIRFPTYALIKAKVLPTNLPAKVVFQTRLKLGGMPLICIAEEAYGVFALGRKAFGIFAFGVYATGCFAFGVLAIGLFSLGVISIGFFAALGSVAVSAGYALGVLAVGSVALGIGTFGIIETSFFHDGLFYRWNKPSL